MAKHVQRKMFDVPEFALETVKWFKIIDPSIWGAKVTAETHEIDGKFWVYITSEGEWVTGQEPLLPGYEQVT